MIHTSKTVAGLSAEASAKAGSLLLHLMFCIAAIAIVATIALQPTRYFNSFLVNAEIMKMHALLLQQQQHALVTGHECTATFDEQHNRYTIENETTLLAPGVVFGTPPGTLGPPSAPQKPITQPVTFENRIIHFYPNGTISSGTIYMTDTHKQTAYAITTPISLIACLRVYRYYNKKWNLIR